MSRFPCFAFLGGSLVFSAASAETSLIGRDVELKYLSVVQTSFGLATILDDQVEFEGVVTSTISWDVDLGADTLRIDQLGPGSTFFDGVGIARGFRFEFTDEFAFAPIVTLSSASTFTPRDVLVTKDSVFVDINSGQFLPGMSLTLDFEFVPSVPSASILFSAGVLLTRRRR